VPNAGHWLHHDQLDLFVKQTREFLAVSESCVVGKQIEFEKAV
jgi:hypothetical protein